MTSLKLDKARQEIHLILSVEELQEFRRLLLKEWRLKEWRGKTMPENWADLEKRFMFVIEQMGEGN